MPACGGKPPPSPHQQPGCWLDAERLPPCNARQGLWGSYLERTRNLAFLEAQLEGLQRAEAAGAEAAEKRLRKMQRCLA